MKKKLFLIMLIFFSLLLLISLFFYFKFPDANQEFSYAIIGNIMSIFWMFEIKNAFKPLKRFGVANPTKGMFHKWGKPNGYRIFCIFWLIIFALIGFIDFIDGVKISFV